MAVREQLEGKDLRRVVVPIPVKDVGSARRRVEAAEQALASVDVTALPAGTGEAFAAELDAARADLAASVAEVVLVSRGAAAAEVIAARHVREEDGGTNWRTALPAYLALLCEDEALRDQEWWAGQLARDEWTPGDIDGLVLGVMFLTADVVRPLVPKD